MDENSLNVFQKNIGKNITIWYTDDIGQARCKNGLIANADSRFVELIKNMDKQGINIDSINRYEIEEGE